MPGDSPILETTATPIIPAEEAGAGARSGAPPPVPPGPAPRLELPLDEVCFRLGLLLGAGVFFHHALGSPWSRNLPGLAGLLLALLIVLTMMLQWRVLGDWRRRTQHLLYAGLVAVLSFPIAAALAPSLGHSALPDPVELALRAAMDQVGQLPFGSVVLTFLQGMVAFILMTVVLVVLLLGGQEGRRAGVLVAGALLSAVVFFFYPLPETVAGFAFLALFFYHQWEHPLLVPDRLLPHLHPDQLALLRELSRGGALSTWDVRLLLNHEAGFFVQLQDMKLVEYDPIAREVLPGPRLREDPATGFLNTFLAVLRRSVWVLFGVLYFLMPDLIPGPIDDLLILAICSGSGFSLFDLLFGSRRGRAR